MSENRQDHNRQPVAVRSCGRREITEKRTGHRTYFTICNEHIAVTYSKGSSDTIEIELPEYVGLDFQTYISQKLRCNGRFAITLLLTAGSEPRLEREARKFDCPAPTRPPTLRFPSLQRPTQRQRIWLDWDELSVMSAAWSAGKRSCPDIICYLLSVVWEGEAARNNVVICPRVSVAVPTLSVICYLLECVCGRLRSPALRAHPLPAATSNVQSLSTGRPCTLVRLPRAKTGWV